jgi:hypothetical protein
VNFVWPEWHAPLSGLPDTNTTPVKLARGLATFMYKGVLFIGNDIWLIVPFVVGLAVLLLLLRRIGIGIFSLNDDTEEAGVFAAQSSGLNSGIGSRPSHGRRFL